MDERWNKYFIKELSELKDPKNSILLLGSPVRHSFSPLIHNEAFRHYKLDYKYYALDVSVEELEKIIYQIKEFNVKGCNITIPHKVEIKKYLDVISKEANLIGAINTIVNDNGKLYGYNTDGVGFYRALQKRDITIKDKKIAILGAGGAARSIAVKLALKKASQIDIFNRSNMKAKDISTTINKLGITSNIYYIESITEIAHSIKYDMVINCTPVGMYPDIDDYIVNPQIFDRTTIIVDIIYNPLVTKFLDIAKKAGMKIVEGLDMLLYQGIEAFRLWTGFEPEIEIYKRTLRDNNILF